MKKALQNITLVALSCLVIVACKKKDNDDPAPSKSRTDLLTAHPWIWTGADFDPPLPPPLDTLDLFNFIPACEKDGFTTFNKDNTGFDDEGPTKCEPLDPQTTTFTWAWMNSEKDLQIIDDSGTTDITNVTLSATTMTGFVTEDSPLGGKTTMKVTFSAK